jgi:hypothetical protein
VIVEGAQLFQVAIRLLQVVAQDLLELHCAVAVAIDAVGPRDEAFVEHRPRTLQHPLVSSIPDEHVVESKVLLGADRLWLRMNEVLTREGAQDRPELLLDIRGHQLPERVLGKHETRDGRRFDHRALLRAEQVHARRQESLDRRWHGQGGNAGGRHPAPVLGLQQPVVDHHRKHLLDKKGISIGGRDDPSLDLVVEFCLPEQIARDEGCIARRKRTEKHGDRAVERVPAGPQIEEFGPRQADDEDGSLGRVLHVLDEVEESGFRPVDVLEDDDERARRGQTFKELPYAPERLLDRELNR